jgi:hypothetical protein
MPGNSSLAGVIGRWAMRTLILLCAGAMTVAAVYYSMYSVEPPLPKNLRPEVKRIMYRTRRRRPLEPQPARIIGFASEIVFIGMVAFGGRRILRLRL